MLSNIVILLLVIFTISFFSFFIASIRGFKLSIEYKNKLEELNNVNSFFNYIQYIKKINPKGGFAPLNEMRVNLLKNTEEDKELIEIVDKIVASHKRVRIIGLITLIIFLILFILGQIMVYQNGGPIKL